MYCSHFQFSEDPFGASPDHRFFMRSDQHAEAVATLYYAVHERRGLGILLGRPGVGKTSVLRELTLLLDGKAGVAFLGQPYFDHTDLMEVILIALGLEPGATLAQNYRLFHQYLLEESKYNRTCVLVFDEAQNLSVETLEAIRMLSNFEGVNRKLVQIVLAGQPHLAEVLGQSDCLQIRQRINVMSRLYPLAMYEVCDYIAHRLQVAGGSLNVFAPDALLAVASGSAGVPRNVNTICFNALSLAYALDRPQVSCAEVSEAMRDLDLVWQDHLMLVPSESSPASTQDNFVVHEHARKEPQPSRDRKVHSTFDRAFTALRRKVQGR